MMGLRLIRGMPRLTVEKVIRQSTDKWRESVIERYLNAGLLAWQNDSLALTEKGRLMADIVMGDLLMKDA